MRFLFFVLFVSQICLGKVLDIQQNHFRVLSKEFFVEDMLEAYAKEKGFNLLKTEKIKSKAKHFGPSLIPLGSLDLYITSMLAEAGYTLLIDNETNQMELISSRDVRYRGGNVYSEVDQVPDNHNYAQLVIPLKHIEGYDVARNLRPFMSRYGRIIDEKRSNTVIIADKGRNIKRLHQLISNLDTPKFIKNQAVVSKINNDAKEIIEKKTSFLELVKDQHILFLVIFSLLGGIIGFGLRGYLMKRVEGGW